MSFRSGPSFRGSPGLTRGTSFAGGSQASLLSRKAIRRMEACLQEFSADLDLWDLALRQLPRTIGRLDFLRSLNLGHNALAALPPETSQLTLLEQLNLAGNRFSAFPFCLFLISSLKDLDLSQNELTSISTEISFLTNLERLNISKNKLTTLPPSIGACRRLTHVYAQDNSLTMLPGSMAELVSLKVLELSSNPLEPRLAAAHRIGCSAILRFLRGAASNSLAAGSKRMANTSLALPDEALEHIMESILQETFPEKRTDMCVAATTANFFLCSHVQRLLSVLEFSHHQERFLLAAFPRLLDPGLFFSVLDAIPYEAVRARIKMACSASAAGGETAHTSAADSDAHPPHLSTKLFDPNDPAGYYQLDLSLEADRVVADQLCLFEMSHVGTNIQILLLDGDPVEMFDTDGADLDEQPPFLPDLITDRADAPKVSVTPEMMDAGTHLLVKWESAAAAPHAAQGIAGGDSLGSVRGSDFVCIVRRSASVYGPGFLFSGLTSANAATTAAATTAGAAAPMSWEAVDTLYPTFRVLTNGRPSGSCYLQVTDGFHGAFEARYYAFRKDMPGQETQPSDAAASSKLSLKAAASFRRPLQKQPDPKQQMQQQAEWEAYDLVAVSNAFYVGAAGRSVRRPVPRQGILEAVFVADEIVRDEGQTDEERFREESEEFCAVASTFSSLRADVLLALLEVHRFLICDAARLCGGIFAAADPLETSADALFRRLVLVAYARCRDRENFLSSFAPPVTKPSIMREVISLLRIPRSEIPADIDERIFGVVVLDEDGLINILNAIHTEQVPSRKMLLVRQRLTETLLPSAFCARILEMFESILLRVDLAAYLHPFLSDPENFEEQVLLLQEPLLFPSESDRQQLLAMISPKLLETTD